jgi:4-hydroxymandelate oxidase
LFGEWSGLPVVVKGVMRGDDAARCVDAGAAAIAISNHGGRTLDGVAATADVLPEIVDAVGGRAEVYVDGGIRSGIDVLRALALGAQAVMIGRPVLWGLAVDGADGAAAVLEHLTEELGRAMALCGRDRVDLLTRDLLLGAT